MKRQWRKLGQLYDPQNHSNHPKLLTHAANPLPIHLDSDVYRIFYSGRDKKNRSSVGAVDIDIIQKQIVQTFEKPFFEHGAAGSFYAEGVSIGNCYQADGCTYMLFMGWQSPENSHWRGDIGRLEVKPDLTLVFDNMNPFMTSDETDPISLSYPWVMPDTIGGYHMWYGSTVTWDAGNQEMLHTINYASSPDGHQWKRLGSSVPYQLGLAQAFSRPTVVKNKADTYDMWFSYRSGTGQKYRIGYARSQDGYNWNLALHNTGIDVSASGWDSEMIEYPFVFDHNGQRYMLYNGNGYGKTGFGLALLEQD